MNESRGYLLEDSSSEIMMEMAYKYIGGMFCKNFRLQRVGTKNGDAGKECFNKGSTSLYINTKPSRLTLAAIPE